MPVEAFNIFALALPHGLDFEDDQIASTWAGSSGLGYGAVLNQPDHKFGIVVLKRRKDFVLVPSGHRNIETLDNAILLLQEYLTEGDRLPVPPGAAKRRAMQDTAGKETAEAFSELSKTVIYRGAFNIIADLYLALPKPDDNFVTDLQTLGFNARIWELYLFACFKEQGCAVSQEHPSPDFLIRNGSKHAYIEAVTTNPTGAGSLKLQQTQFAPSDLLERTSGDMAARFAKTLRSKLQRKYEEQPHVKGSAFALAVADFSGGGTMLWSREALIAYLFGQTAHVIETNEGKQAVPLPLGKLIGHPKISAGLFQEPEVANISAIIFSNAGTLPKFQRMATQAGMPPGVVSARRKGCLCDFSPGALKPLRFDLDTRSEEYIKLCGGKEFWCFEMEVFHNPMATFPFAHELLPGARHWYEHDGEIVCTSIFRNQILKSVTEFRIEDNAFNT